MLPKARNERTAEVLKIISRREDGIRPVDLKNELGDVSLTYAALILSRFIKGGYAVKRLGEDGWCRYFLSSEGGQRLAYLESKGVPVGTG